MAVVANIDVESPTGVGPAVGAIGSQSEQQRLGRAPASLMLSTITVGRQSVGVSSTRERARARAGVVIPPVLYEAGRPPWGKRERRDLQASRHKTDYRARFLVAGVGGHLDVSGSDTRVSAIGRLDVTSRVPFGARSGLNRFQTQAEAV